MNKSGIQPVEYKVLIKPEQIEEKTASGIILTAQTKEKDQMAQVKGVLVAIGGNAFEDWMSPRPEIGNTIYFGKYAGFVVNGIDGEEYRLCNDKDICGIIVKE
jgi:chaperonin GroES